ncbi:MAG TPA: GAF domain-containing protein [Herpetosiphonaceae bacterium]
MSPSTPDNSSLQSQVQILDAERQQTQRALDALYRIGLACRGLTEPFELLHTIYLELGTVFHFDSCFIALCDSDNPRQLRMLLEADEGVVEFIEDSPLGELSSYLIRHRTPLLFDDLSIERTRIGLSPLTVFGTGKFSRGWIGVPLLVGELPIGVVSLQSYTVAAFSAADLELLSRVSNSLAVALENATLTHRQAELSRSLATQVDRRNAELSVISVVAETLIQQQPLANRFTQVLDVLLRLLQVEAGSIREIKGEQYAVLAQRGLDAAAAPVRGPFFGQRRYFDRTIILQEQMRTPAIAETQGFASLLMTPLLLGPHPIGLLTVCSNDEAPFIPEEVELLQVAANQLALALEQAHILAQRDRQIRELEALSHISYAASRSLDSSTLLRQIHDALRIFIALDTFYMVIYDPERNVITNGLAIEHGIESTWIEQDEEPPAHSFTAWILEHREPIFIRHMTAELANYPEVKRQVIKRPMESWLGVPLMDTDDQPIGLISVQSAEPHAFTERDQFFLLAVSSQVSLHVRNLRLFKQRERQLAELNALQRISALTSSTLELEPMISSMDEVLSGFLRLDEFFVAVYDYRSNLVEGLYILTKGQPRHFNELIGKPPPPNTPTTWVINNKRPLRFRDIDAETAGHPEYQSVPMDDMAVKSWMAVPLVTREGDALGVITVQSGRENAFSAADETFLMQVARQLSLSIQNGRLFAERERQLAELDALQRITELISSTLELRPMLRSIDVVLRDFLRADVSLVLVYNPDRDVIESAVIIEDEQEVPTAFIGQPIPKGTFAGWTLKHCRPLRVGNAYADWSQFPGLDEPQQSETRRKPSWLSVPLLESADRAVGVLAVRATRENAFGPRDEQFLLNVGRQLSLNVRNARLFEQEKRARRTADTLREVSRVLNTSFNPDEVLSLILAQLRDVIPYDSASVMLPASNRLKMVAVQGNLILNQRWQDISFPLDEGSGAGRVMLTSKPVIVADTAADPRWIASPSGLPIRSWIGVPMVAKGAVVGVLNINSLSPGRFSSDDAETALVFANQAATALEHARLYQESVTRVEQELEIARQIQSNLFPRSLPRLPGMTLAAVCTPARETGGDFYDVMELSPARFGLMVGDASGKSIPGAMLMAVARSIARSEAYNHTTPRRVLRATNHWVAHDVPPRSFVALAYATIDTNRRVLSLTNAGQLDPLLIRADGTISYLTTPGPHLPLGIRDDTQYESSRYQLRPGDLVLFYTDGVVEAQTAGHELWGFERLEETLREVGTKLDPNALVYHIMWAITSFIGDHPQHDDITLVALRVD